MPWGLEVVGASLGQRLGLSAAQGLSTGRPPSFTPPLRCPPQGDQVLLPPPVVQARQATRPWRVCGSERTSLWGSLSVSGCSLPGGGRGACHPSPGPLGSCCLLGLLLSSVVMGLECHVLSPDVCLRATGRSADVQCGGQAGRRGFRSQGAVASGTSSLQPPSRVVDIRGPCR